MSENVNFCPECGSEYREGFTRCSDCDVDLVQQLGDEEGDALVALTRQKSSEVVGELLDRLEQNEIPYVIEAGTGLHLLDGDAGVDAPRPREWEARVFVAASSEDRARELLEELLHDLRARRDAQ